MTTNTKATWKFQHDDGGLSYGYPTDARGLDLRLQCGFTHVNTGDGWLQIAVAIRKAKLAEQLASLAAAS